MKKTFYLVVIISLILSGCSNAPKEKTAFEYKNSIANLEERVLILEKENKQLKEKDLAINSFAHNKYNAGVIQIGGIGSRFTQTTTYVKEDENDPAYGVFYLYEKDLVSISFNNPADIMTVSCKDGYNLTSCESNSENDAWNEEGVGHCRIEIEDKIQNRVQVECEIKTN